MVEFLKNMSASADVLAMAKVEVDLNAIPEGKNVIIKWRGKPVFIRHRTAGEIDEANKVDVASLRDPQTDEDRVQKPEWLVMLGTLYLGSIPRPLRPNAPRVPQGAREAFRLTLLCLTQVSVHILDVCPLARPAISAVGSALATALITISLDVYGEDLPP